MKDARNREKSGKMAEVMAEKPSILYVGPGTHRAGHSPQAVIKESTALLKAGAEVSICTFQGVLGRKGNRIRPDESVVSRWISFPLGILTHLLFFIPKEIRLTRFLEQFATLCLAVRLKKQLRYDVIFLRDGDPFIFIPFVLGFFHKQYRWAITLLGLKSVRSPSSLTGCLFYKLINAPIWKPIYFRAFSRNRFAFLCENSDMRDHFETNFLDGILAGKVGVVPVGLEKITNYIPQKEARQYLDLPEGKAVFLHFGFIHRGKDIETILAAMTEVPDAVLVSAGKVGDWVNLEHLVKRYGLQSRVVIRDYYIHEADKQYYFAAADAIILSYKRDFLQTASLCYEAARFKLPAVASDVGELGELIKGYKIGLVFKPEDANSLRGVLSDFLSSGQREREAMASNCEKFCDDFSLDNWSHKCMEVFMELCGRKGTKSWCSSISVNH